MSCGVAEGHGQRAGAPSAYRRANHRTPACIRARDSERDVSDAALVPRPIIGGAQRARTRITLRCDGARRSSSARAQNVTTPFVRAPTSATFRLAAVRRGNANWQHARKDRSARRARCSDHAGDVP